MKQFYYTIQTLLRGQGNNMIKIVSLTLGLFVGILLFSRVAFELNYDSYYQEPENLFLTLRTVVSQGEKKEPVCSNYGKLPAAIRENFPDEVEDATLIDLFSRSSLYHEGQEKKDAILATSRSHIFSTLGVKVLSGNVSELDNMDALFISRSLAQSLFADADPIGKTVMINIDYPLTVRGVFEDIPENDEFRFDGVYSFVTRANRFRDERGGWRGDISYTCMVRFRHPEDVEKVAARMPDMMKKYIQYNKDWFEEFSFITPSQFHLQKKESRKIISILSILGFAILLIAGMNNVLISISSLPQRAKSVGVHKCSGASTGHIYRMFLWESALLILVSLLGVIVLLLYFKPEIEDLSGASLATLFTWRTLWVPALVTIFLFLLIGLLPGKLFSSIPVTQVFHRFTGYRASWKYPLLFVQFTGVAFILGLLMIILLQYNQVMNRSMGYKIDNLVIGWGPFDSMDKIDGILRGLPFIEASCNSASFIYNGHTRQSFTDINGKRFMGCIDFIDEHYVPILGLQILQGRNVHQDGEVLVNEELLRQVGWTDSPIGRKLMEDNYEWGTVVGVVKDYVAQSAYQPQASVALVNSLERRWEANKRNLILKEPFKENLSRIRALMKETFPTEDIQFRSARQEVDNLYQVVRRFRNIVIVASVSIVVIVLMGLFGFVNDEVQRRSKEIAIRKVNGAESGNIINLLNHNIFWIALPAIFVGIALAYVVGHKWVEQFTDQINLNAGHFLLLLLLILLLILGSVTGKSWRIANENPVNSIKNE